MHISKLEITIAYNLDVEYLANYLLEQGYLYKYNSKIVRQASGYFCMHWTASLVVLKLLQVRRVTIFLPLVS